MDQRRAAAALFALAACFACASAAPTASNQTALDLFEAPVEGCYYNFQHYGEGDRIMTNEPCLNCTCHNRMLMCYLRVCPFTKAIGQDCTVEKRADQCCPIVTCPDVPVDLLTSTSTSSPAEYGATGLGKMDKYGCSINGKYFPEGSKVPPTPNKPCEHCYCIHNMTTCVMQECTLHVDGCTPIYHKDVCCPIRYSCDHPEDEIPLLDDMTTTVRPTPGFLLTTTTMMPFTQASQECVHENKVFADGALIKTEKACEHCYCMKGDIVCVVQECGRPMENEGKNCTSLPPKQGQCCPDTYICEGDELSTTQFYEEMTTVTPPRRFVDDENGYRNEPDETFTEISLIGNTEEGSGEDHLLSTISSLDSETPIVTSHNMYPYSTEINTVSSEITTYSDIEKENTILTTLSPLSITPTISDDLKKDKDEEKVLKEMTTTGVPIEEHVSTTSVEDNLIQNQNNTLSEMATTISSDQYSTVEPTVTTKLNEISELSPEITTKQTLLDNVDNLTPVDEEFIIATKLPEKNDDIESGFEEPITTFKPMHVEDSITDETSSETTPKLTTFSEQSTHSSITTSSQETTTINVQENEILEETLPARIPGEGDCLLGGVTFKNNTSVPSTSKCHSSCRCVSSIIKCDPIICTPPLEYMENMNDCQPIYDSPESCCPTYVCSTKETVAPESHSQMSGTETPKPIECVGDECHINQESKTTEKSVDRVCDQNGCQETEQSLLPQNVCPNGKCDSKEEEIPVPDSQPCDETNGCQVPVIKPCEDENCITKPVTPTDIQDKLDTDNKPCINEHECQVPVITPCTSAECRMDSNLPDNKETEIQDKETKDEENTCIDENCRRKQYDETKTNVPCSGIDCTQDTISPIDVNKMSSPKGEETIQTTKPDISKQPEEFTSSESQTTLEPFKETTVSSVTSSEIKEIIKDNVTDRDETTTQTSSIDENLVNHQIDTHLEADKPSTESSLSDLQKITTYIPDVSTTQEHLPTATEKVTTEYSFNERVTSDETKMQYTTIGVQSEITTEVTDKIEIKTEAVTQEDSNDSNDKVTGFPILESTTANTLISSQSDQEEIEDEYIHTTRPSSEEERTTHIEKLGEEITTSAPPLVPFDTTEKSSDATESEMSITKEISESDLSVQPISGVDKEFTSKYPTTEKIENVSSTLVPDSFTKSTDDSTTYSTEESKKEANDLASPDLPTVTESTEEMEEVTEIVNKQTEHTTFQPESHKLTNKQTESEITPPSTIEENQTQITIEKDIPESFTEVIPAVTTESDQKYSHEDHSEINPILSHKEETQTKIPESKYTEASEDFTTAFTPTSSEDKTSDIRKDNEPNTEASGTKPPSEEDQKTTISLESKKPTSPLPEVLDVDIATTTLRVSDVNEPYTTSKSIETTHGTEFEKTIPETFVTQDDDKIHTTISYNEYNDISKETTKLSLPTTSERINEIATEIITENYEIKDIPKLPETSTELDITDDSTHSPIGLDKTDNEQSTESSNELVDTDIVHSTELSTESQPEILFTDEMTHSKSTTPHDVHEEMTSAQTTPDEKLIETSPTTSKSITTLFDEAVEVDSTMTSHESLSPEKNDFGQTEAFEKEKLPTTSQPHIMQTETSTVYDSEFTKGTSHIKEEEETFISTTASIFDSDSESITKTSPFAVDLEQASTDSSEPIEKQTLPPMSLITEKTQIATETVTDTVEKVTDIKSKEPELTTILGAATTAGMDSITTKLVQPISETVTPSIDSISEIKHFDVTTELVREESTPKPTTSQLSDEIVTGAVTEQSHITGDELTTRSEPTSSSTQIDNESKQELPNVAGGDSTLESTTLAGILKENDFEEQSTEAQSDVSKPSTVTYESQGTTDYPTHIEEKTKQPELLTTELMTESVTKSDQTTEEPLLLSTVHHETSESSVDEESPTNSQDGSSTPIIVDSEPEKITEAPETPVIPNDADTIKDVINKEEIDTTKQQEPEVSTEKSYEIQKQPTTISDETFIPTQTVISSYDTPVESFSTENIQTTMSDHSITKSPDVIGAQTSTESILEDKIDRHGETTEAKYEYSETTPYFIELEEHTHQIMQETTDMPLGESSTEVATGSQSTERGDQSLSDLLSNEVETEKATIITETPQDDTQVTTQSDKKQGSNDVYTTGMPEISTSIEEQKETEIKEPEKLEPTNDGIESTMSPSQTSVMIQTEEPITSLPLETRKPSLPDLESTTTEKLQTVLNEEVQKPDVLLATSIPDEYVKTTTPRDVHEEITSVKTTLSDEKLLETSPTTSKSITSKPDYQATDDMTSPEFPPSGVGEYGQEPDYGEEEQAVIPGICRYGGKVYGSTQQIPRDDPCDFCFCFRSDIICLQQSCPPPIHGCREEPIQGFCCPRYECPVSMATTLNVTTTTTTTTTTLPPHFLPHAYKGAAQRRGCHIKGHSYKVGEVVRASSGPCLHCTCGGDGQMKCDPKACTPEPMLRQMIAAAVSSRRR